MSADMRPAVAIASPMRRRVDFEPGRFDAGCSICDAAVGKPCGEDCLACRCSSCSRPVTTGSG